MRSFDNTKVKKYISSMEATAVKIKGEPDIIKKAFDGYVLMHLNISMVHETFSPDNKESFFAKVRTFKRVCKVDIYQNAINNTKFKQCKSARMLPILFVKLHLEGLSGLIYMLRARWNAKRK